MLMSCYSTLSKLHGDTILQKLYLISFKMFLVLLAIVRNLSEWKVILNLFFCRGNNTGMSRASVALLLAFCSNTRADYSDYVPQLLRGLIHLFTHTDDEIIKTAWLALSAVTKVIYTAQKY